jgi:lipopolysaccharide export LptBFGC system permease protein LptF
MMIAAAPSMGQLFEGLMLVCFGFSWPFAIWKTYRTKRTEGKSMIFLVLVILGYFSGMIAKFYRAATEHTQIEPVTALYGVLALFVAIDLVLVIRYRKNPAPMSALPPHE